MTSSLTRPREADPHGSDEVFQFGIEEEYFLGCARTLSPPAETPDALFNSKRRDGLVLERELLQAQLEVATRPHVSARDMRRELMALRTAAACAAADHGLAILACGTHPLANWRAATPTRKQRYAELMDDLQMLGRRNMLCGMHVHVELPDPSRRIEVMARAMPYVPLFVALSTSSPFWECSPTGLKGYRLAAYDELPRTGLPELFVTEQEYRNYIEAMRRSGAIKDGSHVWWSMRPAESYPTLELRAPDCCTRIDDAVAIASLYRALVRHLYFNPEVNRNLNEVDRALAVENKWRAQRYGVQGTFVSRSGAIPVAEMLEDVCEQLAFDTEALDCVDEIYHCRSICAEGTSADAQLRIFSRHEGRGLQPALNKVARWIADATLAA
jgi:carboxylate-amine ligase